MTRHPRDPAAQHDAAIKITAPQNAVLCYAEWCADNKLPFPKLESLAYDVNRSKREIERAFSQLETMGLLSARHYKNGMHMIVRLGDGRETGYPTGVFPLIRKETKIVDNRATATLRRKVAS